MIDPENHASQSVAHKLGFSFVEAGASGTDIWTTSTGSNLAAPTDLAPHQAARLTLVPGATDSSTEYRTLHRAPRYP